MLSLLRLGENGWLRRNKSRPVDLPSPTTLPGRDGPWPDPSILLTRSKLEADPPLTQVLFDPTRSDFFLTKKKKLKNLVFLGEIFQLEQQKIDQTQPGSKFLTRTHHYSPCPSTQESRVMSMFLQKFQLSNQSQLKKWLRHKITNKKAPFFITKVLLDYFHHRRLMIEAGFPDLTLLLCSPSTQKILILIFQICGWFCFWNWVIYQLF